MAKTLQRKFMFASMLAVTILLVTLVGAINIMNCCAVINRQKVMLEMLCERDGRPEGPGRLREMDAEKDGTEQGPFFGTEDSTGDGHMSPDSGRQQEGMPEKSRTGKNGLFQRAMTMDEALAIRFFAVWYDEEGQIILTDCSHIYAVTEEGAREMAQSILSLGKNDGVYLKRESGSWRLRPLVLTLERPSLDPTHQSRQHRQHTRQRNKPYILPELPHLYIRQHAT